MSSQHLSDEAIAAFADGVLGGLARDRATRHVATCAECGAAVRVQREAVLALRAASAPQAPAALFDRLRALPLTTPLPTLPTAIAADGSTMLATFNSASAFVPEDEQHGGRMRPYATTVAVVALAGALVAGSVASQQGTPTTGTGHLGHGARHDARTTGDVAPGFGFVR